MGAAVSASRWAAATRQRTAWLRHRASCCRRGSELLLAHWVIVMSLAASCSCSLCDMVQEHRCRRKQVSLVWRSLTKRHGVEKPIKTPFRFTTAGQLMLFCAAVDLKAELVNQRPARQHICEGGCIQREYIYMFNLAICWTKSDNSWLHADTICHGQSKQQIKCSRRKVVKGQGWGRMLCV